MAAVAMNERAASGVLRGGSWCQDLSPYPGITSACMLVSGSHENGLSCPYRCFRADPITMTPTVSRLVAGSNVFSRGPDVDPGRAVSRLLPACLYPTLALRCRRRNPLMADPGSRVLVLVTGHGRGGPCRGAERRSLSASRGCGAEPGCGGAGWPEPLASGSSRGSRVAGQPVTWWMAR